MKKLDVESIKALCHCESVPSGRISASLLEQLTSEHLVSAIAHGSRVSYRAVSPTEIASAFADELKIADTDPNISRAELVMSVGDSKALPVRSCPGFPVNSYEPVPAIMDGRTISIDPAEGTFLFVCDWQHFAVSRETIVIGVENMENFRNARSMKWLFEGLSAPVLFVSRYPQSRDLVCWLKSIPNRYLHFGDLDLAGVHIFLTEFHQFIGDRASFFIPFDAEVRLSHGSRRRYDAQVSRFGKMSITDPRVQFLVDLIHKHHRGYDQEGYLRI